MLRASIRKLLCLRKVNESFIKYLIDEINSKEIPLTGDTSITDIYNLKAFESILIRHFGYVILISINQTLSILQLTKLIIHH